MKPRTVAHVTIWLAAMAVIAVVGLAEFVITHGLVLVLAGALAAGGAYLIGRRAGRAGARKANARRLEDARRLGQLDELERLAARPVEAIVESYRTIRRNYTTPGGSS